MTFYLTETKTFYFHPLLTEGQSRVCVQSRKSVGGHAVKRNCSDGVLEPLRLRNGRQWDKLSCLNGGRGRRGRTVQEHPEVHQSRRFDFESDCFRFECGNARVVRQEGETRIGQRAWPGDISPIRANAVGIKNRPLTAPQPVIFSTGNLKRENLKSETSHHQ